MTREKLPAPEIATLLARAAAARYLLEGLLAVVPDDAWERPSGEGEWTVRQHVAHVAAADRLLVELLERLPTDRRNVDLDARPLLERREPLRREYERTDPGELAGLVAVRREEAASSVQRLAPEQLGSGIVFPAPSPWEPARTIVLRSYLAAWAGHDHEHAAAIRDALTAPLEPGAIAAGITRRGG